MIRNLLRFLGWVCLLVCVATGVVALVYFLSERPQKVAIEQRVLDAVDVVREDGTTAWPIRPWPCAATSSWRRLRTRRPRLLMASPRTASA
jgi:hypothetical protein